VIRKRQDDCKYLENFNGQVSAYAWKAADEWGESLYCRCLAEIDNNCPKKRNKRKLSVYCWSAEKDKTPCNCDVCRKVAGLL